MNLAGFIIIFSLFLFAIISISEKSIGLEVGTKKKNLSPMQ